MAKPKIIDLFCGAGGLSLGFEKAGFQSLFANDNNQYACGTFHANHKSMKLVDLKKKPKADPLPSSLENCVLCGDVEKVKKFPKANGVVGGYPCQGFSLAGKRLVADPRNKLYLEFSRCVKQIEPDFFVAENVKGLITLGGGKILEAMIKEFESINDGYNVSWKLLNAKNYGVPQDRERIFIVGTKKGLDYKFDFPKITHDTTQEMPKGIKPVVTLRNAIGDMPKPNGDECYRGSFSTIYMSRQRRRGWDDVSYTIQAGGRHAPLHPSAKPMEYVEKDKFKFGAANGNRRLSYKECMRVQTFPDSYAFEGSLLEKYNQLGNAVPVKLAEVIAKEMMNNYKG